MSPTVSVTPSSIADLIEQRDELLEALKAFEVWEAHVILHGDWSDDCVKLTPDLHEEWLQLAAQRNAAIAKVEQSK